MRPRVAARLRWSTPAGLPRSEAGLTVLIAPDQKITTFLMFEGRAEEAMSFYVSVFDEAEVNSVTRYGAGAQGPEGSVQHATFTLAGQQFMCIDSPVPHGFGFTPAMSLFVQCGSDEELARLYAALAEGGRELMPLGGYGFSKRFRLGRRPLRRLLAAEPAVAGPASEPATQRRFSPPGGREKRAAGSRRLLHVPTIAGRR